MPTAKKVVMSYNDFKNEHKRLIKLLQSGSAFVKEAKAQTKELGRWMRKK